MLGSNNNGNFLGIIELLAQFDPFLADHLSRFDSPGRGNVSYLSATTCNEFIVLMAKKVITKIISDVKAAKYFAISVDSTPDISHVDQLTFIIRFVDSSGKPVERFLKFIPLAGHDGESMMNVVIDTLHEHDLSIKDCRSQSYDNASNMSGKYQGLQARIKQVNPRTDFVPYSAHSLNLVGSSAAVLCQCNFILWILTNIIQLLLCFNSSVEYFEINHSWRCHQVIINHKMVSKV